MRNTLVPAKRKCISAFWENKKIWNFIYLYWRKTRRAFVKHILLFITIYCTSNRAIRVQSKAKDSRMRLHINSVVKCHGKLEQAGLDSQGALRKKQSCTCYRHKRLLCIVKKTLCLLRKFKQNPELSNKSKCWNPYKTTSKLKKRWTLTSYIYLPEVGKSASFFFLLFNICNLIFHESRRLSTSYPEKLNIYWVMWHNIQAIHSTK